MLYRFGYGKKSVRRKSKSMISRRGINAKVVDPSRALVNVEGALVKLPKNLLYALEDATQTTIRQGKNIKILDPINGVFEIAGDVVEVPFDISQNLLGKRKRKSRKSKSKRRRKSRKSKRKSRKSKRKSRKSKRTRRVKR